LEPKNVLSVLKVVKFILSYFKATGLYWNANSIQKDIFDFFFNYIENSEIDIALLGETFLKPNMNISAHPDYIWYRMDRLGGEKGEVADVIRPQAFASYQF
jgi:hypothetical protein